MKILLLLILQLAALSIFAQSPQLINYQGIARDASGLPITGNIDLRFQFHQGTVSSPTVFSEQQTVSTTSLGLFTTQIGKVSNLNTINWEAGSLFLEVSVSISGASYISLGTQQLVSAPYALHAQSVPSTFTNNILTIGTGANAKTYTFTSLGSAPGTSITSSGAATVTSSGTNTFNIDVPATSFSAGTNVVVQGTHPNYTISSTPSLSINGNNLSISGGNTIPIPTSGTIAAVNTTIVSTGAASTTTLAPNSFSINVPVPTFTGTGQTTVLGSYPNYTINTPTVTAGANPTIVGLGAAVVSPTTGANFTVTVPPATVSASGNTITITQGTSVTTATISGSPTTSLVPAGVVSMTATGTNSFIVGVPNPVLTSNGNSLTITQGTAVSTATVPSTTYTNGTGISITSGSIITNTSPDQVVTISSGNIGVSGSYPNFILSAPSPSFTQGGIVNITTLTANSYSVGVDVPSFTQNGPVSITGTYPALTVNSPAATTYTNGTGISITSGSIITNTSPDQIVSISSGNIGVSGSYPSFVLSAPSASLTAGGIVNISTITANSFSVSVSPATIAVTFSGAVNPAVTATGNSYNINIPPAQAPNITISTSLAAAGIATTSANNFNINVPSPNIAISQTAAAVGISTTSANNYNINIPLANGAWGLLGTAGTSSTTNFIGTTDPTNLIFKVNSQKAGVIDYITQSTFFGYQSGNVNTGNNNTGFGNQALLVNTSGVLNSAFGHSALQSNVGGGSNTGIGRMALFTNVSGSFNTALGREAGYSTTGASNVFLGYQAGYYETGSNKLYISNSSTSLTPLMYGDFSTNSIGIGTVTPYGNLHVYSAGSSVMTRISSAAALTGLVQYADGSSSALLNYENTPLYFGTNGANRMVISNTGAVGIGNSSPTATLHITGNMRLVDGTQGAGKFLTSDASGNASWASSTGWGFTGNAGTTAGTNFIGTTDAQDLVFKSNNTEVFRSQSAGVIRLAAGADRTITVQTQTSNNDGNNLYVRGSDAGIGGQARNGGALIVQGGDGYNQSNSIHFGGNVFIRPGKNQYGAASYNSGSVIFQSVSSSNAYFEAARIDPNGNFGLGITTPAYQLELSSNSAAKPTSNAWTTTSDSRLKTNVHAFEGGLKELMKINPVWFTYTGEAEMPRETGVGVIAQELQKIAPYMIKEWIYTPKKMNGEADYSAAKTTYLGVDNGPMTYMMINAIKEQQKQIEELKKITEEQKKLIEQLLKK